MTDAGSEQKPARLSGIVQLLNAIVPLLWVILAGIGFYCLLPLARDALNTGSVNKVKLGIVEIELAHVPVKSAGNLVDLAKEAMQIPPERRKRISERFAGLSEKLRGATLLWVDDNHPFQNVAERRVLSAAGISIDTARSTQEAINWLARANYDVLITDSDRSSINDPAQPCFENAAQPASAGCALLKQVGSCFQHTNGSESCTLLRVRPNATVPTMIVYSGSYQPEKGTPPFAAGMTNRSDALFDLVLDALEKRDVKVAN